MNENSPEVYEVDPAGSKLPADSPPLDIELARRLVASQFPQWAELPVTAVELNGWDNRTFRLGDELTVRLPSGPWYALQVEKEQRWLPLLAPHLPLPIPIPEGRGVPGCGYPYAWSVYRWLEGRPVALDRIANLNDFATQLAAFLVALRSAPVEGGPGPGPHNWFRGGPLATYAAETLQTVDALGAEIPRDGVLAAFDDAMSSRWDREPVWVHGDIAHGNLLLRDGRLGAVIDFGSSGVGDPACDVVIAWTLLAGSSRVAFRNALGLDPETWSRGRGWALWKALITLAEQVDADLAGAAESRRVIEVVLADRAAEL